jgi:uncharacterized repeat protein (TIGR01451 family)
MRLELLELFLVKKVMVLLLQKNTLGESVFNNFVSELNASNISEENAIEGIVYWGYGRFARIAHNTIALGNPSGGALGRLSTTGNTFGVHGLSIGNNYFNNASYPSIIRNNIISINAVAKGSTGATAFSGTTNGGFNACWRTNQTSVKKKPLGIDNSTGGNVYFINDSVRNYIYAQGINSSQALYSFSGLRNAYGYYKNNAPASYQNTTYNLVNDTISGGKYFNINCGKYKSFWGSPERSSYIDINALNNFLTIPFVNSGSTCADKLKISSTATSFVVTAAKLVGDPLNITTDYFSTTRNTSSATAGAHAAPAGASGSPSAIIDFDYEPICDGVCTGSKSLTVSITPPTGKSIPSNLSDAEIPRVYYRRVYNNTAFSSTTTTTAPSTAIVDNNWFYRDGLNNKTGPSGWRFVKPTSVSGNNYVFNLQDSLFSGSVTANQVVPTYTVEYFVIASTTDGTVVNWSSGDLSFSCPTSVILNNTTTGTTAVIGPFDGDATPSAYNTTTPASSALNHGTGGIVENSVADNYTIYKGSDLTRTMVVNNNGLSYSTASTTNPTTASVTIPICTGENVNLNARIAITATGEMFKNECITYKFQVANDLAFTSGVQNFSQSDTNFNYLMSTSGTKYFRYWLDCGGTNVANSNSNIIAFTASDCPTNTSPDVSSSIICLGTNKTISVTTSTATVSKFFWVVNPFGKPYNNPPTSTTTSSSNITITPSNISETGTWKTYVTNATGNTVLDQVVRSVDYYNASIPGYLTSGGDAIKGKGIAFTTTKFIKLNAVSMIGATGDGTSSSGHNINLYGKSGDLIYTTAGTSIADNTATATSLTNWFIPPGDYVLALDEAVSGTAVAGAFASLSINAPVNHPNTVTPSIIIQGGVESVTDFDNADISTLNYFVDWDYTEYCTSPKDTFVLTVNPTSCCTVPSLPIMTITSDSAVNTCGIMKYTVSFNNTTGAIVNNIKFTSNLFKGQFLVDSSILGISVFGSKVKILPEVYVDEPNFVLDSLSLPIGTSSFTFQVDVRTKAFNPLNIFSIENDCIFTKRSVTYPTQTCAECTGGIAVLKNGTEWGKAGITSRNSNLMSNIVVGNPTSGQIKADVSLSFVGALPSFEYQPSSYPRKNGNYVQIARYDNRNGTNGSVIYRVSLKDSNQAALAAKPSFKIAGIGRINGQADVIKVYGICGADTIKGILSFASTTNPARNTYSISNNIATAVGYYYTSPNDFNSVLVNFEKAVTSVIIDWTMSRTPTRTSYKSLYIGDMTFTCNKEPEPIEDNIFVETSLVEDSLPTCTDATIRIKLSNQNCDTKTIDLFNNLPAGLKYVDSSFVGINKEMPYYVGDSFYLSNIDIPSGNSYIYIKVRSVNPLTSGNYDLNFNYTVVGGTNNPNPYRSNDIKSVGTYQDSKLIYYVVTPIVMPTLNLSVIGCLDTAYNGSIITYKVSIVNNSNQAVSNISFEEILDSNQLMIANSLIVSGINTGWIANRYDTFNFLTMDSITVPANTTGVIEFKISSQDIKTEFLNAVSIMIDPSNDCAVSSVVNSEYEQVKFCTINCILVNPRITYRHRKQ